VAATVADHPLVTLIDIERLRDAGKTAAITDVLAAEEIVAAEVDSFVAWHRGTDVAPTVAALRARADDVVAGELRRLGTRRGDLSDDQRADIAHAMHRVVQRLLHEPTVRVRQRASEPGGEAYASVLRELFDLPLPAVPANQAPTGALPHIDSPPPLDVSSALSAKPEAHQ
jgi:glutamyl-tRNA reductase